MKKVKQLIKFLTHWYLVLVGKRLTIKQIVNDTLAFYTSNPRSVGEGGSCLYNGLNGEQCAFRRYVQDDKASCLILIEMESCRSILDNHGFTILKPEVQWITDKEFWKLLQCLHDGSRNWNEESPQSKFRVLTSRGIKAYQELLNFKYN